MCTIPGIRSTAGLTYKIDDDWNVFSFYENGDLKHRLKPDNKNCVEISRKLYTVHGLALLAGLHPARWPEEQRESFDINISTDIFKYRILKDSQGHIEFQRMNNRGDIFIISQTKNSAGYCSVKIAGKRCQSSSNVGRNTMGS